MGVGIEDVDHIDHGLSEVWEPLYTMYTILYSLNFCKLRDIGRAFSFLVKEI